MRKEYSLENATFIYSKDELGYAPLLEEMKVAKEVTIITYNISERQHQLLDCLKATPDDCNISIITNIPNRWDTYYKDEYRKRAQQKIKVYMTKLSPEDLGKKAAVYFNFNNHGKIIMTDSSIYIGSANFSEESTHNIEFGIITRDAAFLAQMKQELIPEIKDKSIPYYEYDYSGLLVEANMLLTVLFCSYNELFDEVYITAGDWRGDRTYYNDTYDLLSQATLSKFDSIATDCISSAEEIAEVLSGIKGNGSKEYTTLCEWLNQLRVIYAEIVSLAATDSIVELADFKSEEYIHYLLETDYAMEADEENLDDCISLASDRASSELLSLCETTQQDLEQLVKLSKSFHTTYGEIVSFFSNQEIQKISPEIDNT